jgi:hypothetical protein
MQRAQAERERLAREELEMQQQREMMGQQMNIGRMAELEREILAMRGQWERDQIMLEKYDSVRPLSFSYLLS